MKKVDEKTLSYVKYLIGLDRIVEEVCLNSYTPFNILDAFSYLGYKIHYLTDIEWDIISPDGDNDKSFFLIANPYFLTYSIYSKRYWDNPDWEDDEEIDWAISDEDWD